jgi:hypothetical protein
LGHGVYQLLSAFVYESKIVLRSRLNDASFVLVFPGLGLTVALREPGSELAKQETLANLKPAANDFGVECVYCLLLPEALMEKCMAIRWA